MLELFESNRFCWKKWPLKASKNLNPRWRALSWANPFRNPKAFFVCLSYYKRDSAFSIVVEISNNCQRAVLTHSGDENHQLVELRLFAKYNWSTTSRSLRPLQISGHWNYFQMWTFWSVESILWSLYYGVYTIDVDSVSLQLSSIFSAYSPSTPTCILSFFTHFNFSKFQLMSHESYESDNIVKQF